MKTTELREREESLKNNRKKVKEKWSRKLMAKATMYLS